MTRTLSELPADHQRAVAAFAAKHGKHWKAKLADAWGMGTDTREADGWALRDIRNNPAWGHAWLKGVSATITTAPQIIARGHFNTGRLYTKEGQLIDWYQLDNDLLLFKDRSRMVHGFIKREATTADVLPAWLMGKYDHGLFDNYCPDFPDYLAPRALDADYGPALKI